MGKVNDGRSGEELASPEAWGYLNQAERYNDLRGPLGRMSSKGQTGEMGEGRRASMAFSCLLGHGG